LQVFTSKIIQQFINYIQQCIKYKYTYIFAYYYSTN